VWKERNGESLKRGTSAVVERHRSRSPWFDTYVGTCVKRTSFSLHIYQYILPLIADIGKHVDTRSRKHLPALRRSNAIGDNQPSHFPLDGSAILPRRNSRQIDGTSLWRTCVCSSGVGGGSNRARRLRITCELTSRSFRPVSCGEMGVLAISQHWQVCSKLTRTDTHRTYPAGSSWPASPTSPSSTKSTTSATAAHTAHGS
jgi:hypothetical protein